jgi:hypothetical protein
VNIELSRRTLVAALGDAAVIVLFAFVGRDTHREHGNYLFGTLGVAAPFLIGWYLSAIPLGAYSADAFRRIRLDLIRTARSWLVGGVIGLIIRSFQEGRPVHVAFIAVALSVVLVWLTVWRLVHFRVFASR